MPHLSYDFRIAIRSLVKARTFSIVTVLTLAIGIGAAVTLFAAADGIMLRRLPVAHEDRIALLNRVQPQDGSILPFGESDLEALQGKTNLVEDVGGVQYDGAFPWVVIDDHLPTTLTGSLVSGEFFRVLGAGPALGRLLEPGDAITGAEPVVVLSYRVWQARFAGDPRVLGRRLRVNGDMRTVIGVAPRDFEFHSGVEIWVPAARRPTSDGGDQQGFSLLLRSVPNVSHAEVIRQLSNFVRERQSTTPGGDPRGRRASIIPIRDAILGDVRQPIAALSIAVGLVLVIAVANVAGLILVRGVERQHDLAIRSALGAGRRQLTGQLLVECFVLVACGAAAGLLLADVGVRGLLLIAPESLPRLDNISLNVRGFAFASVVALVVTSALGLASALAITRVEPSPTFLRSAAGNARRRGVGAKESLVVLQVALALLVAVAAGLLLKSLARMRQVDLGYQSDLSVAQLDVPWDDSTSSAQYHLLIERITARVGALGGVAGVTPVLVAPFSGQGGWNAFYALRGQSRAEVIGNPAANLEAVMPNYFRTLGIPILIGRGFTADDRAGTTPVVIVSRAFARRAWPSQDPIGKQIGIGASDGAASWLTVVGVAGDARYRDLLTPPPTMYLPLVQSDLQPGWLLVQPRPGVPLSLRSLQSAVTEMSPEGLVLSVTPLASLLAGPLSRPRFVTSLAVVFAVLALGLAAVGLYGLMSSIIAWRGREMGIRMALGAETGRIRRMVLGEASLLAICGVVCGLALSAIATRWLQSLLYETGTLDAPILASVTTLVLLITAGAAFVPARRATRVDPAAVLRAE